ncbi:hypothetical protein ABZP36_003461 [Zizania latifolia]
MAPEAMVDPPIDDSIAAIESAAIEEEVTDLNKGTDREAQPPALMAVDGLEAGDGSGALGMEVTAPTSAPSIVPRAAAPLLS